MMKVFVGCEKYGRVRDAFARRGHQAFSVDLQPSVAPGSHIQGGLEHYIHLAREADIGLFFPACTFICGSGLHWNKRVAGRREKTEEALRFVCMVLNCGCPRIGLENPVGCISTRIALVNGVYSVLDTPDPKRGFKPTQVIQPYMFGEDASKATCLWLIGLPPLQPTCYVAPRIVDGRPRWANQTDSGQNRLGPSETRAEERGITYRGIAEAMASQWGALS